MRQELNRESTILHMLITALAIAACLWGAALLIGCADRIGKNTQIRRSFQHTYYQVNDDVHQGLCNVSPVAAAEGQQLLEYTFHSMDEALCFDRPIINSGEEGARVSSGEKSSKRGERSPLYIIRVFDQSTN